ICPESLGSSPNDSNKRPNVGMRAISNPGPNKTLCPVDQASRPTRSPYCCAAARSHVAASAMGAGGEVDLPSLTSRLLLSIRTPAGPSANVRGGMPSREGDNPAPLCSRSILTFSACVICLRRRFARSYGESDLSIHCQSRTEVEGIRLFSISLPLPSTHIRKPLHNGEIAACIQKVKAAIPGARVQPLSEPDANPLITCWLSTR